MLGLFRQRPMPLHWLLLAVLVTALLLAAAAARQAPVAQAFCQGNSCLPNGGYTNDHNWNCGVITPNQSCWDDGKLSRSNALTHSYGWGSADYDGGGSTSVCLEGGTTQLSYFGGCGTNLIRACFNNNCADQDGTLMNFRVFAGSENHTIKGHAKF